METTKTAAALTGAKVRALRALAEPGAAADRSGHQVGYTITDAAGGKCKSTAGTIWDLRDLGYVVKCAPGGEYRITDAGRAALGE